LTRRLGGSGLVRLTAAGCLRAICNNSNAAIGKLNGERGPGQNGSRLAHHRTRFVADQSKAS
jgi:hypothetical protein